MNKVECELKNLMDLYIKRYEKLESERQEAKQSENLNDQMTVECLQRQCRIMIAELFKTMKNLGIVQ